VGVVVLVLGGILSLGAIVAIVFGVRGRPETWAFALTFGGVGTLICGGFAGIIGFHLVYLNPFSDAEIETGRPCTATVLSVAETRVGGNRSTDVFEFRLRVLPVDGSAYEVTIRDEVNFVEAGRAGAGIGTTAFPCVIDRGDDSRVHVFWLNNPSPSRPSGNTPT